MHCTIYLIWSYALQYNYPMPFNAPVSVYPTIFVLLLRLWFIFPKQVRQNTKFRSQLEAYIYYCLWLLVIYIQIIILTHVFTTISKDLQWVMAILVPLIKNFDDSISMKIICRASGPDTIASKSVAKIYSGTNFSLRIVIMLGTAATDFTSYCILGVNVLINIYLCFKIIRLNNRTSLHSQRQLRLDENEVLTELVLNEVIEIIIPFAFICSFAIAYYGPNSGILGNIGNDYWTFRKVNDITPLVKSALTMSLIDFLSAIITMIVLWKCCRINAIQQCCKVLKKYWQILSIQSAMNVNKVNFNLR